MQGRGGLLAISSHLISSRLISVSSGAPLVFSSCCAAEAEANTDAEAGGKSSGKSSGCPGAQHFEALGEAGQPRQLRFAGAGGGGDVCVTAPISGAGRSVVGPAA